MGRGAVGGVEGEEIRRSAVTFGLSQATLVTESPKGEMLAPGRLSLGPFRATRVTESPKGEAPGARERNPGARELSLGLFYGVGRLPRTVSRHLTGRSATRGLKGDGFGPKNVPLGR